MFREILYDEELVALRLAFDEACSELNLTGDDTERREHLALVMLSLAKGGETDANRVRDQAVHLMQTSHQALSASVQFDEPPCPVRPWRPVNTVLATFL